MKQPCVHMLQNEDGGPCDRRCDRCPRTRCVIDDAPVCSLLNADDRTVSCPFAVGGNADHEACKRCPLPAYHAPDPVTRLQEAGFRAHLDDLAGVTGGCLDEDCSHSADCVTRSGPHVSMCHLTPARLRLMYLGAEWRRRNHPKQTKKRKTK